MSTLKAEIMELRELVARLEARRDTQLDVWQRLDVAYARSLAASTPRTAHCERPPLTLIRGGRDAS